MGLSNEITSISTPDQTGRFRTHANYLCAFSQLVFRETFSFRPKREEHWYELRERIQKSGALPMPTGNAIDQDRVKKFLNAAWGTEALLLMGKRFVNEEELLRLSNNWSIIQTYYILYHCTQALHVAKGQKCLTNHSSIQKTFHNLWASRSIVLGPWSLAYSEAGPINVPDGVQLNDNVHNWNSCDGDNAWNIAIKALRTTREREFPKKEKQKREDKRHKKKVEWKTEEDQRIASGKHFRQKPAFPLPRLTKNEKTEVHAGLRPYTLIDYLYRLRIKTNYDDSSMFTDGPDDNDSSWQVRDHLCKIAGGSLLLHELSVMKLIGRDKFLGWAKKWESENLPDSAGGIKSRLELF